MQGFCCGHNKIKKLPSEIGRLVNLQYFSCNNNKLTNLPSEIGQLINLEYFIFSDNPIVYIPPNVKRLINRLHNGQKVYKDTQSVHNHQIQESIRKSILNLLNDELAVVDCLTDMISNKLLSKPTKSTLVEYCIMQDVHSSLNITFGELFNFVWSRIIKHKNADEILKILEREMRNILCNFLTGRMVRLVNCLNGFYDDITIRISDDDQISNIILVIKSNLNNKNPNFDKIWRKIIIEVLVEREYPQEIIDEWTGYIG